MPYIYESIQNGIFKFTIPGEDKTVTLFKGSKVTVQQKLSGSYLRVLKLIEEIDEKSDKKSIDNVTITKPEAKVKDKITKVEEVAEIPNDKVQTKINDKIIKPSEERTEEVSNNEEETAPKKRGRRKN